MNSDYLDKMIAKKQELKKLHAEKTTLKNEQSTIQSEMEGKQSKGEAPDQSLVDRSKELQGEIFTNQSEIAQSKSQLTTTQNEYAKALGEEIKQAGAEKPESAKEALQTPIGLRKGKPIHQYQTPYQSSKEPKLSENLKPSDDIKDWNESNTPQEQSTEKANEPKLNQTRQRAIEKAKEVGKDLQQEGVQEQEPER